MYDKQYEANTSILPSQYQRRIAMNAETERYRKTSKKQYELLSTIVQHYFPGSTMETEDLRKAVSTLPLNGSQASIRPQFESHDPAVQNNYGNALTSEPNPSPASEMIDQEFIIRDAANLPREFYRPTPKAGN